MPADLIHQMQKDAGVRQKMFQEIFLTPVGKAVLAYLKKRFDVAVVDVNNPYHVYYRLGRLDAVKSIEHLVYKENERKENDTK